jgi:hypothetical protein
MAFNDRGKWCWRILPMIPLHYVWLAWASAFLLPWAALLLAFPQHRAVMVGASALTAPFGLSEPLFVPRYWNPPSLFDLAEHTGFDIESVIFCFGIGGVGAVLYNISTRRRVEPLGRAEQLRPRHHLHRIAVLAPAVAFPALLLSGWNPIYPAMAAMAVGATATTACRPDLARNTLIGGLLFAAYYALFMLALEASSPGYIDRVWNLRALSGVRLAGVPAEELVFAFAFGAYWSGVYEHLTWRRDIAPRGDAAGVTRGAAIQTESSPRTKAT